ncbi:PRC-barrel domain-containing protein [Nanoarchaeota archaeon]
MAMLKIRKLTETFEMKVFTDSGDYFGDIEEAMLTSTKVTAWRVRSTKNSYLSKVLGSAKGVVVPQTLVQAIGDIMIISKNAVPSFSEAEAERAPIDEEPSATAF